jgi:uncharacterized membrane protein YfcA
VNKINAEDFITVIMILGSSLCAMTVKYIFDKDIFQLICVLLFVLMFRLFWSGIKNKFEKNSQKYYTAAHFLKIIIAFFIVTFVFSFFLSFYRIQYSSFSPTHFFWSCVVGYTLFCGLCVVLTELSCFVKQGWEQRNG